MQEKVELIKSDGSKLSLDIISIIKLNINSEEKHYILLTENEVDPNGLIKILVSEISDGRLIKIENANDWTAAKNAMRAIISSSKGEFSYIYPENSTLSFVIPSDYAKVIAIQEVAKQQLIKDYIDKKVDAKVEPTPETPKKVEDPNSAIYPQQENNSNSNSEVVPGIAEVTSS